MAEILFKKEINSKLEPDELIDLILKLRGIKNKNKFLHPTDPINISLSEFGKKKSEIDKIIKLLIKLYQGKNMVVVYCDYDADGITGGAVMWETLYLLGFNTMPYVPDRKSEGYGFSKIALDRVKTKFNPSLIISVDHGITAKKHIAYAKKIGIDVIVTDHHYKQEEKYPDNAFAVIHIPELSGSGAAYFTAKEIFARFKKNKLINQNSRIVNKLEMFFALDYAAIAAVGTVADLVPLVGPSRSLVFHGLKNFSKIKRPGIVQILKEAKIENRQITPYEIGYIIAPRINAVGRLKHAIDALRLLCTKDSKTAFDLASKIGNINVRRQDLVKLSAEEAKNEVLKIKKLPKIIILKSDTWHEGVIGLIAGKMLEEFYQPTIVMTKGDGFYKASARSIANFHITNFLSKFKKLLTNYGGHAGAAGFTIPSKNVEKFISDANKRADKEITKDMLIRKIESDIKIPVSLVTKQIYKSIEKLNPFGIGNPKPTFYSDVTISHAKTFGKMGEHLKLLVNDHKDSKQALEMIVFGGGDIFRNLSRNQPVKIAYKIDINFWNGRESLRGVVRHLEI